MRRARYSGFHQGAGEITATELIAIDYPKYGLILIEIETSLHPRAKKINARFSKLG
jgi:hypothetical protein